MAVHVEFLPDTVAMVSPLPALGGTDPRRGVRRGHARPNGAAPARADRGAPQSRCGFDQRPSTGFLMLGLRGLPRRYQQYDDIFQPLQVVVGVAAAVTVLGALLALRSTRPAK